MSHRLFALRLAAIALASAAPACQSTETHEACYQPGSTIGEAQVQTPPLPCLPKEDPQLSFLNPGCTEDFKVKSGPTQKTANASCCYTVEYERIDGCQVGRPLRVEGAMVTAALIRGGGWAG